MEGITFKFIFAVLSAALGSGFQHGYNTGVVNNPQKVLEEWFSVTLGNRTNEKPSEFTITMLWSSAVSIYCVGGMIGGGATGALAIVHGDHQQISHFYFIGALVSRLGPKWSLMINNVLVLIAGCLMGLSKAMKSVEAFIVGRFFIGINNGLNAGLCPMYLTEISPVNLRGAVGSMYQFFIVISILLAQIVSVKEVLGSEKSWPFLFGAVIIALAVVQCIMLVFCPESPKHLIQKDKNDKAKDALVWFRGKDEVDDEFGEIKASIDAAKALPDVKLPDFFKDISLRRPLIISNMIMLAQQLSGINAVIFFSTKIFTRANLSEKNATLATIGMGGVNVLMTIVSVVLVEVAGRKTLLVIGFAGLAATTTLLTGATVFAEKDNAIAGYICIVLVYIYIMFFASGAGSIPWFLVSEMFNQAARPTATSIAVLTNWTANTLVGLLFLPIAQVLGPYVFLIFVVLQVLFLIYIIFQVPETRNRPIEEITALFKG